MLQSSIGSIGLEVPGLSSDPLLNAKAAIQMRAGERLRWSRSAGARVARYPSKRSFAEKRVQWSKSGSLSLDGLDPLCRVVDEDGRGGGLVMCAFNGDVGIVCIAS